MPWCRQRVIASGKGLGLQPVHLEVSGSNPPLVEKQELHLGFPPSQKILKMPLHFMPHIVHRTPSYGQLIQTCCRINP